MEVSRYDATENYTQRVDLVSFSRSKCVNSFYEYSSKIFMNFGLKMCYTRIRQIFSDQKCVYSFCQ